MSPREGVPRVTKGGVGWGRWHPLLVADARVWLYACLLHLLPEVKGSLAAFGGDAAGGLRAVAPAERRRQLEHEGVPATWHHGK